MSAAGGLQAPQGPALLHPAPLRGAQQFRNAHACRRQARVQAAQLGARHRASGSIVSCSSETSNGGPPPEQFGSVTRLSTDDCNPSDQISGGGGRTNTNGANGAYSLDDLPASLNGSNGIAAVPQRPRLVGAYDSDSEQNSSLSELDQRILGGEFTDAGSTKAKLTRPARKVLSKGFGPGEQSCSTGAHHLAVRYLSSACPPIAHCSVHMAQFSENHLLASLAAGKGPPGAQLQYRAGCGPPRMLQLPLSLRRLLTHTVTQRRAALLPLSLCARCRAGGGAGPGTAGTHLGARCCCTHAGGHRWAHFTTASDVFYAC
jgi:hypothetical protein